jgi:hypothetical protein
VANGNGLFFASDIGIPSGGRYTTGDVGALTPVPLPPSLTLLAGALGLLALTLRRAPRPRPACASDRAPPGAAPAAR